MSATSSVCHVGNSQNESWRGALSFVFIVFTDASGSMSDTMFSRSGKTNGSKCDAEIKALVPDDLKQEITALAVMNKQPVSEYVRDVLFVHVHGHLEGMRMAYRGTRKAEQE